MWSRKRRELYSTWFCWKCEINTPQIKGGLQNERTCLGNYCKKKYDDGAVVVYLSNYCLCDKMTHVDSDQAFTPMNYN